MKSAFTTIVKSASGFLTTGAAAVAWNGIGRQRAQTGDDLQKYETPQEKNPKPDLHPTSGLSAQQTETNTRHY